MQRQTWHYEDIENILWAIETVGQAIAIVLANDKCPKDYRQGYKRGFETTLQEMIKLSNDNTFSQNLWSSEQTLNMLLATQTLSQASLKTQLDQTRPTNYKQGFHQGVEAALHSAATAFGVNLLSSAKDSVPERISNIPQNSKFWFQIDVHNLLLALLSAFMASTEYLYQPKTYNDGFEAGLRHLAKLFGVRLLSINILMLKKNVHHWLRKDIQHELYIAYQSIPKTTIQNKADSELVPYWQGFKVAIMGVSNSFGIKELA